MPNQEELDELLGAGSGLVGFWGWVKKAAYVPDICTKILGLLLVFNESRQPNLVQTFPLCRPRPPTVGHFSQAWRTKNKG